MVFQSGTSTAVHDSTGVGFGLGSGGPAVGFGGARTTSTSISSLAAQVAPPQPRPTWLYKIGVILPFPAFTQIEEKPLGAGIIILIGVVSFVLLSRTNRWNKKELPKLVAQWERRWLCHKCGTVFDLN